MLLKKVRPRKIGSKLYKLRSCEICARSKKHTDERRFETFHFRIYGRLYSTSQLFLRCSYDGQIPETKQPWSLFTIQKYRWRWLWMCYKLNMEQVHTCSCQMVIRQNLLFVTFLCFANVRTQFIKSSFFRYKTDDDKSDCFEGIAPQILSEEIIIKRHKYFISIISEICKPIVNL